MRSGCCRLMASTASARRSRSSSRSTWKSLIWHATSPPNAPGNPRTGSSSSDTWISSIVRRHMRCSGRSASGGFGFARPESALTGWCEGKWSISSAVDIGSSILEYFDQAAKGGKFDNPIAGLIDFFVLEFPGGRMWNETRAQAGGDGGIDVRARAVTDHESQRRIEAGVLHQAPICLDVLLARGLDAIEERSQTGARELLQLFVALALGEHEQPVTARQFLKRRFDVGQQRAVALEQMRADSLDLVAQAVVTRGREFSGRLMQRHQIRAAAVAMRFDKPGLGATHRSLNLDAG